jgi:hypothetical protein
MRIPHFTREEYLARKFDYRPGQHLGMWEPTEGGKTHFAYQLLDVAMRRNPHLRAVSAMPKSRSPATRMWAGQLGLKIIGDWPPPWSVSKPRGYVLWPPHLSGVPIQQNRDHLTRIFRKMLADQLDEGDSITLADDLYKLAVILDLNMDCEEFWTAGAEGGAGLWGPNQKPSGTMGGGSVSSFSYNSPTYLVFGNDTDERNQRRFAEIGGGIDPKMIAGIVPNLRRFPVNTSKGIMNISEKLVIDKRGPYLSVVGV